MEFGKFNEIVLIKIGEKNMEIPKELLEEIKSYIEAAEVRIDSEFGDCRELHEIVSDSDMPEVYVKICTLLEFEIIQPPKTINGS